MSGHQELRERIAAVLDPFETVTASDGNPSLRTRTAEELADAVLAVLVEHPDKVLDLLELEQVGWRCVLHDSWDGYCLWWDARALRHTPVYVRPSDPTGGK